MIGTQPSVAICGRNGMTTASPSALACQVQLSIDVNDGDCVEVTVLGEVSVD